MNMALPAMSTDLGLTQATLTWVVNIYTLVFASLLFISGAVGDRYGRKLVMQIGLGIFTAGALYAGIFAQTGPELIISRVVMGIGGAFVMPTTLSIINNTFPKKERARAVAIWGAVAGVGMMLGSIISGILLEHFTWHSLFYFSGAVAILGFIANQVLAHESKDEEETPVDWLGGVFSTIAIFGLVYGITEAPNEGITYPLVLAGLIGGAIALVAFIWWELKTKTPMLDMKLFKNRAFTISSIVITLVFFAMAGVMFSMSQLLQLVLGYSPLEASLHMIPIMLPMMFVSPIVPSIVKKIGARLTLTIGLILVTIAFIIMSGWTAELTYLHLFATMFMMMLGISLAMTPSTNILISSVPRNRSGMGSAMNDTTREFGAALGVGVLGAILGAVYQSSIAETAKQFTGQVREGLESSLAVAVQIAQSLGDAADSITKAAYEAFMNGITNAASIAAIVIALAAVLAFVGLPRHTSKDDDTI